MSGKRRNVLTVMTREGTYLSTKLHAPEGLEVTANAVGAFLEPTLANPGRQLVQVIELADVLSAGPES